MPRAPRLLSAAACAFLAIGLGAPAPLLAQDAAKQASFTASVAGVTAGRLMLAANATDTRYSVSSRVTVAGIASLFSSFVVDSKVVGRVRNGTYRPERYTARAKGDRSGRSAVITYAGGVPTVVSAASEPDPEAPVIDPATMGGSVDPQTAMYAVLRDVPASALCTVSLDVFDGHRHSRVDLRPAAADRAQCDGLYSRLDGYTPAELAERKNTAFAIAYTQLPDGMFQVREITFATSYGTARLTRD